MILKNGNLTAHYKGGGGNHRRLCWDEENRLRGVADDHYASIYGYDAGGERAVKFTGTNEWIDVNGSAQGFASLHNLTLYTSPYLVASQKGYTKHYYIENQRIASKLGNGGLQDLNNANQAMTVEEHEKRSAKVKAFKTGLSNTAQCLNLKHFDFVFKTNCPPPPNAAKFEPCLFQYMDVLEETEPDRYYYHPDHLGSASWITDAGGKPIQHLAYLPFGEEFVDQRTSDWSAAYKFTGKEKDEETGYNYFGARYYMSDIGIWASPDPLSDMYPSTSSYAYCRNNPVILVDPNGMNDGNFHDWTGAYLGHDGVDDENVYFVSDRKSRRTIRKNDENKTSTDINSVKTDFTTTKSKLKETIDVDTRTTTNNQTREEATALTTDGRRYTGQGEDITQIPWEKNASVTIEGIKGDVDTWIHSHLCGFRYDLSGSGQKTSDSAYEPSAKDKLNKNHNLNVITGPLGHPTWNQVGYNGYWTYPEKGAVFYDKNWEQIGSITIEGIRNILKH